MDLQLEIEDFLGFCDLNGIEAIQTGQVQQLEKYIRECNEARGCGKPVVANAVWGRLMQVLRKVNPESELCKYVWEGSEDTFGDMDALVVSHPMYSLQTVTSFECEGLDQYIRRLPDGVMFDAHVSVKLNGRGIRLIYRDGLFVQARGRARASAGRDFSVPLQCVLYEAGVDIIEDLAGFSLCEVRGELVLPFCNLEAASRYKPGINSAFSGVAALVGLEDEEAWKLLHFVAYEFVAEDMSFETKQQEYDFLEGLGFTVPLCWEVQDLCKDSLVEDLKTIVSDCEAEISLSDESLGYDYATDGLVFTVNDYGLFRELGGDGSHYNYGNMALKVGYWQQDVYQGFVQTILWMGGKTKVMPVAIIGETPDMVEFVDEGIHSYIFDLGMIASDSWEQLGVVTLKGERVRCVPLYEPAAILVLDAYPGSVVCFHYDGEMGAFPCFEDGTPLVDGYVRQMLDQDLVG